MEKTKDLKEAILEYMEMLDQFKEYGRLNTQELKEKVDKIIALGAYSISDKGAYYEIMADNVLMRDLIKEAKEVKIGKRKGADEYKYYLQVKLYGYKFESIVTDDELQSFDLPFLLGGE